MTIATLKADQPILTETEHKPRRKIIRKSPKIAENSVSKPKRRIIRRPKHTNVHNAPRQIDYTKPKKIKQIRRVIPQPEITTTQPTTTDSENIDPELSGSGSEDDVECIFTVSWHHNNNSYLLDENTQEVFSKKDHSLIGLRYIDEDELSVIDFNYADEE